MLRDFLVVILESLVLSVATTLPLLFLEDEDLLIEQNLLLLSLLLLLLLLLSLSMPLKILLELLLFEML